MTTLKSHGNTLTRRNRYNTVQYAATRHTRRKVNLWKLAKWTSYLSYVCYILLAYQVYGGITQMVHDVKLDIKLASDQYKIESACVRKKIALGIERIDIATKDGTCWVEDNGYYNYH